MTKEVIQEEQYPLSVRSVEEKEGRQLPLLHRFLNQPLLTIVIQIFQKYKQTLNGILQFKFLNTTNGSNHEARWSRIP